MIWHTWLVLGSELYFPSSESLQEENFYKKSFLSPGKKFKKILEHKIEQTEQTKYNMTFQAIKILWKNSKPVFCVWMHVLLIRVHRNWKLAKSLIGNDLAPTEDRSEPRPGLSEGTISHLLPAIQTEEII